MNDYSEAANESFTIKWPNIKTIVRQRPETSTHERTEFPAHEEAGGRASTALYFGGPSAASIAEAALSLAHLSKSWGGGEPFEDGIDNEVSRDIEWLVMHYKTAAIDALRDSIDAHEIRPHIVSEVLLWLGQIDDPYTRESRFYLLLSCLKDEESWIRSSAAVALASIEDYRAAGSMARQAAREENAMLRARLESIALELEQLKG